jgi:hypothetical protein
MHPVARKKQKKDYAKIYDLFSLSLRSLPSKHIREYKFCDARNWRIDFFFPQKMLAVEIEGGAWIEGRHNRASSFISDMEKYNMLARHRIFLMRFTPSQVERGEALVEIEKWFMGEMEENN